MLSPSESLVWEALEIGPQWLLRETPDPLLPETGLARPARAPSHEPQPLRSEREAAAPGRTPLSTPLRTLPRTPVRAPAGATPTAAQGDRALPPGFTPPFDVKPAQRSLSAPRAPEPIAVQPQIAQAALDADTLAKIPTADWETLRALAEKCACCRMAKSRQHMVFAEGGPGARIAIVGEAPGSEEDLQGIPFVGKSGQLLTSMLEALSIVRKKDTAILNVLKCRPPGNRNPLPEEVACCQSYLRRQLELINPDVILIMGRFAVQTLLNTSPDQSIGSQRGRVHQVDVAGRSVPAVVSYHPSYLLRSPDQKAKAWEDLVLFKHTLQEAGIELPVKEKKWM